MDPSESQPDFYTRLLGIAPGKRPPNYYELLGLALFTSNFRWIESAVHRRMEELDPFALHPDAAVRRGMQELVTEVAQARVCLVDPETKRKYDRELAASLGLNTETVDLPAPGLRRKIAIAAALAACAVMVIAVAVAAVLFLHGRNGSTAQHNGAGNAPGAVAVAPANQPANVATQPVSATSHPAEVADARQKELDALVAQARGLCDAGNFEPALNLLTQAQAIRPSPQLVAEIKKVQDAKLQHDQAVIVAQALAKLLAQAEATLQTMPPDKARLSPAQKDQLKQLQLSLDAPAATNAQAAALRDRIDVLLAPDPKLALDLGQGVSMNFRLIPKGEFMMGTAQNREKSFWQVGNLHKERIASGLYVGIYSVTQAQWKAIMGTSPWKQTFAPGGYAPLAAGDNYPAQHVTWDDAVDFCRRASAKTGRTVRLPTEAQREYACRAGSSGQFCYGDDPTCAKLGEYAWFAGNTQGQSSPLPVGLKKPNAFGLYDMHGNVGEYCMDPDPSLAPASYSQVNGVPAPHVFRGGFWCNDGSRCRSDARSESSKKSEYVGFRAVVDVSSPDPAWDKLTRQMDKDELDCGHWVDAARGLMSELPQNKRTLSDQERLRLIGARHAAQEAVACNPRDEGAQAIKVTVDEAWSRFMEVEINLGQIDLRWNRDPVTMRLVRISPGVFTMGSPPGETGRSPNEGPQRKVAIGKPFYLGVYSVIWAQWVSIMGTDPATKMKFDGGHKDLFPGDKAHPVVSVSWNDAAEFCRELSKRTGRNFHLPTEAQREYACRAGSSTAYFYGDDPSAPKLKGYVWSLVEQPNWRSYAAVMAQGKLRSNDWGLYNMLADVQEWCADYYADSYDPVDNTDPAGPAGGALRVLRGAALGSNAADCRCASRKGAPPGRVSSSIGFRVVMDCDDSGGAGIAGKSATQPDKVAASKPAKEAPETGTWKIVSSGEPGVKNYFEIHDDGTATITTYTPGKGPVKWASIRVNSGEWTVHAGQLSMNDWELPLPLQDGQRVRVNGKTLTLTRMVPEDAAKEFKTATVPGANNTVPGVWRLSISPNHLSKDPTLSTTGMTIDLTFYDNHIAVGTVVNKAKGKKFPGHKSDDNLVEYAFGHWNANGNGFGIEIENDAYWFPLPLNRGTGIKGLNQSGTGHFGDGRATLVQTK